jgi:class 3 adenylate cyclase
MNTSEPIEPIQTIEYWSQFSDDCERTGNYLEACDRALLGLQQHPKARELQYRAVLNLSRAGANKRAQQLWLQYQLQPDLAKISRQGGLEENIAALGARLDREQAYAADVAQRPLKLKKAAERYESIYLRTRTTFRGINAAVLNELSGDSIRAKEIAADIIKECGRSKPRSQEDTYQLAADRATASLLLDDFNDAQRAITHAATLPSSAFAIASTRKQLIQICEHKRIDPGIASSLRNRTVIHYTGHMIAPHGTSGRFVAQAEARVAKRIQSELARRNVGYGYGSLACGADTLIAEALLERKAEVNVVLPFETESFLKESVANGEPNWIDRFNRCFKQASIIHATDGEYNGDAEVFAYASRFAMGLAVLRAQHLSSEILQLAVWDGQETGEKAGTWADIQKWKQLGLETITVSSEGNLTNGPHEISTRKSDPLLPPRKVRAILFGDFHGFSRLTDRQMLIFSRHVMSRVAEVLDEHDEDIVTRNTWGDGIFVVLSELGSAARCALDIQSALAKLDFVSLGLPTTLGLRLGVDAGAVFEIHDPILKTISFTGGHVNRTARLELSTPPGEVYVTEAFAALFTLLRHKELICEYVGMMKLPKGYGRLRTYLLRRGAYTSPD